MPLLAYPDLSKPMVLYTDASDRCIGAVLMQPCPDKDGPVIEKQAFAIQYAVQKLNYYLSGAVFTIKTDHQPLKYLLEA